MYVTDDVESMKIRVEKVVETGKVGEEHVTGEEEREAFNKWTQGFTCQDHPSVILLRVSAIMTNAPIILTLDCDMYSNDIQTLHRMLCYITDSPSRPNLGYIQFPQRFHGLNEADIYACELKRVFQVQPVGMDGLSGPSHFGTGCFFRRRVFFGAPSSFLPPEFPELSPDHVVEKPIKAQPILALVHLVAGCNYENQTNWGSKTKRWSVGLLEVAFSKYCPVTFGAQAMGPLMGLNYAHLAFMPIWSIPITTYAFLAQLALLNKVWIFPKVLDLWFVLHVFLFLGAYAQDCLDFILAEGTIQRWWSDQRMWIIRGLSPYLFGLIEFVTKNLGVTTQQFNVTSKVVDDEHSKRYDQGTFEFGVPSPMFVPLAMAATINLVAFLRGLLEVCSGGNVDGSFVQMFMAGFGIVNCFPIYEAMVLRTDKGRMPIKTTIISIFLSWALYTTTSLIMKI
ncbi:unnamed protein product [Ilex paraguariensis]|uniref:Cellulose synthase-like protein G3 n=1 Tax=Ilex paraguariensis TaxID=185542 RepID=A0ABC8RSN3_9AQUA